MKAKLKFHKIHRVMVVRKVKCGGVKGESFEVMREVWPSAMGFAPPEMTWAISSDGKTLLLPERCRGERFKVTYSELKETIL